MLISKEKQQRKNIVVKLIHVESWAFVILILLTCMFETSHNLFNESEEWEKYVVCLTEKKFYRKINAYIYISIYTHTYI